MSRFFFYLSCLLMCLPLFSGPPGKVYSQTIHDHSKPAKQAIHNESKKAIKKKSPSKRHGRFELHSRINTEYTSNLFKVARKWENQFDTKNVSGQRFEGLEGPADAVSQVAIEAKQKWKFRKKRSFAVFTHLYYNSHLRNTIANYVLVGGGIAYDITRHSHLKLYMDYIPSRFKKNYKVQIAAGKTYKPAYYFEFKSGIRYRRDWNKKWSSVLGYGLANRNFEDPFTNRNRISHKFTMQSNHDLFRRVSLILGLGYTAALTPSGIEFGVSVNRSYHDMLFKTELNFDLPNRWDACVGVKYRMRNYTTDVPADPSHYDRKNGRWATAFELKKKVWKKWLLSLDILWMVNQTNKDDDELDPDIRGYRVFSLGAGIKYEI